ncbi:HD domain-containing protein, partial [bacterium]|nr:HD domain-containing protein [bacterium]
DMINGFIFSKPSIELENIQIDLDMMHYSLEHSTPLVTNNLKNDPRFKSIADNPFFKDTKAVMIVPICSQKKKVGVMLFDIPLNEKKIFTDNDLVKMDSYSPQCAISLENAFLYTEIREVYFSTIQVLSSALDAKDSYTEGHSQRVTEYSIAVAEEMNLPKNEIEMIQIAAILHDIGKIGIRDFILCKPGKLTNEEFEIIKNHPTLGSEIVSHIAFLADKATIIRHHHERFDGKGYPDGLKEQDIPIGSRIIAVCDSFDAMTSKRSYRDNMPVHKALAELKKCSGSQFDAEIADIFIKIFNRDFQCDFEQRAVLFKKQDIVENE